MVSVPNSPHPRVSIVVVAARSPDRLVRCVESVVREAGAVALELVVVLNAAEPGLEEALRSETDGVRVVSSEIPLGFAGGVNLGVRHARGELLHILHDDTEVCPGWLDGLIAALEDRPEAGAVGSLILDPDGTVQSAGAVLWRDGRTDPRPVGPSAGPTAHLASYPVDYCASASLLVRRDAWEAIGGLDERFHPAYYVDVDLAMGLRSQGYLMLCEPRSHVRHAKSGSSRDTFRSFVSGRNRELFAAKWEHDLARQEPYATDPAARARAREATERRAREVAEAPRPTPLGGTVTPLTPETAEDRLRREQRQLLRDLAVKDAYVAELERVRAALEGVRAAELEDAAETRRRLEADGAIAQRALVEAHEELRRLHARVRTARAIEDSRPRRPRGSLLGLRALGHRVRRLTRRAGTSRTG